MMLSSPKEGVSGVAGTILAGLVVRPNKGAQHWFQRQIDSKKKKGDFQKYEGMANNGQKLLFDSFIEGYLNFHG